MFVSVCAREVAWIIGNAETFSMFFQYSIHVKLVWRKMIFQHFSIIFFFCLFLFARSAYVCDVRTTPTMTTIIIERKAKCNGIMSVRPKTIKFNYSCEFLHGEIVIWSLLVKCAVRSGTWVSVFVAHSLVHYVNARRKSQQMNKKALTMSLWNMVYAVVTSHFTKFIFISDQKVLAVFAPFICLQSVSTFCVCVFFSLLLSIH